MRTITKGISETFKARGDQRVSPDWRVTLHITSDSTSQAFEMESDGSGGVEVSLSASATSSLEVGMKNFAVRATNGDEAILLSYGRLEVKPDPTEAGDKRSQIEKDLEAVDKAIRDMISGGAVQSYQIQTTVGSRQLTRMTIEELKMERRRLLRMTGKSPDRWRVIKTRV